MKTVFWVILCLLCLASVVTVMTEPHRQTDRPVMYWKSDANPQRYDQIDLFHKWLIKNGHVDKNGKPVVELRLDAANTQSKLIQAVSGVGGDIIDTSVTEYYPLGVLADISEGAKAGKYSVKDTYPGLEQSLAVDGKQYGYPCNSGVAGLWINDDTFAHYEMKRPPEIWTPEQFEKIGKEFVKRANKDLIRREIFFCSGSQQNISIPMLRSEGLDMFNETQTACILDDDRYVKLLKLLHKWTYTDHLFPSAAELLSMNTESGYGGGSFSQFQSGKFAMIYTGRYCLIRFRESVRKMNMSMSRIPEYEFQNMIIRTRSATLYKGSTNKEYAKLFFTFLADKEYNDYIIKYADGLPPNPKFTENNSEYYKPKEYPNEGNTHTNELKWARTIALPDVHSPYYKATGMDWQKYAIDKYFNGLCSAEEAAKETARRINAAIQTTIKENKTLRDRYELDCKIQKKIDQYKAAGKKIPASWIKNPYYRAYYKFKGMIEEPSKGRGK